MSLGSSYKIPYSQLHYHSSLWQPRARTRGDLEELQEPFSPQLTWVYLGTVTTKTARIFLPFPNSHRLSGSGFSKICNPSEQLLSTIHLHTPTMQNGASVWASSEVSRQVHKPFLTMHISTHPVSSVRPKNFYLVERI